MENSLIPIFPSTNPMRLLLFISHFLEAGYRAEVCESGAESGAQKQHRTGPASKSPKRCRAVYKQLAEFLVHQNMTLECPFSVFFWFCFEIIWEYQLHGTLQKKTNSTQVSPPSKETSNASKSYFLSGAIGRNPKKINWDVRSNCFK